MRIGIELCTYTPGVLGPCRKGVGAVGNAIIYYTLPGVTVAMAMESLSATVVLCLLVQVDFSGAQTTGLIFSPSSCLHKVTSAPYPLPTFQSGK